MREIETKSIIEAIKKIWKAILRGDEPAWATA